MKGPTLLLALLATTLLVAACGSDEAETTGSGAVTAGTGETTDGVIPDPPPDAVEGALSDRRLARRAIEVVLIEANSRKACVEAMSDAFLKTAYGDLDGCIDGRPKPTLANAVAIESINVDGDRAEAVVTPVGGLYDGEELEATVVREGEGWKVDELVADIPVGP